MMNESIDSSKMLKKLYNEFVSTIKVNMRTTHNGEEIFIHDVLMDMHFIGHEMDKYGASPKVQRDREGIP